jgi:type IV pilus assembly protein PilA
MPEVRPTPSPYPQYAPSQQQRRPAWFWIAIGGACLSVVVPILVILALITLPGLLRARNKPANQVAAIHTLRSIRSAEKRYNATYPEEGFACSLNVLGGNPFSGPPSSEAAHLISPGLASTGHRSGYVFSVTTCTPMTINHHATNTAYTIAAIPESVGKTGDVGYCINQDGVITVDPPANGTAPSP